MTILVAWVWQGLALAAVTAVTVACAPRVSAATRHAIWWFACAGVLVLPIAYVLLAPGASTVITPATVAVPATPDTLLPAFLIAWGLFAAASLMRVGASIMAVYRLKGSGREVDALLASRLHRSRAAHLLVHVRVSDRITGACALGLGSPVILLSRSLVPLLDDEALAAVVLHEHAHLDRHDDWWQLLQAIVGACAGWHPAVWLIGRQIAIEREAACDDRVLGRAADPRAYARALLRVAEFRQVWGAERRLAIPGAAVSVSMLRRRVRRLLDMRIDRTARPAVTTRAVTAATAALLVAAAARVPAVIVFEDVGAQVPGVERTWLSRALGIAPPAPVEEDPARTPSRAVRVGTTEPSARVPQVPIAREPLALADGLSVAVPVVASAPLASRTAPQAAGVPSVVATGASSLVPQAARLEPRAISSPSSPWVTLGRSASAGGVSIGRFFTRAAKGIAGSF